MPCRAADQLVRQLNRPDVVIDIVEGSRQGGGYALEAIVGAGALQSQTGGAAVIAVVQAVRSITTTYRSNMGRSAGEGEGIIICAANQIFKALKSQGVGAQILVIRLVQSPLRSSIHSSQRVINRSRGDNGVDVVKVEGDIRHAAAEAVPITAQVVQDYLAAGSVDAEIKNRTGNAAQEILHKDTRCSQNTFVVGIVSDIGDMDMIQTMNKCQRLIDGGEVHGVITTAGYLDNRIKTIIIGKGIGVIPTQPVQGVIALMTLDYVGCRATDQNIGEVTSIDIFDTGNTCCSPTSNTRSGLLRVDIHTNNNGCIIQIDVHPCSVEAVIKAVLSIPTIDRAREVRGRPKVEAIVSRPTNQGFDLHTHMRNQVGSVRNSLANITQEELQIVADQVEIKRIQPT